MPPQAIALLGAPARAQALRERLSGHPIEWTDTPAMASLNLLLDAEDAAWRQRLLQAGLPFQVVQDDTRAMRAIGAWLGQALVATDESVIAGRGRWVCESCSDPECERRLFRDLIAGRG